MSNEIPQDMPLSPEEFLRCSIVMAQVVQAIVSLPLAEMVETIEKIEHLGVPEQIEVLARAAGTTGNKAYEHQARVGAALLHVKNTVLQLHAEGGRG